MFACLRRPASPRRGVTLVEMLVVVALLVLMMTILVQIFQATTGTMTASRTIQELDISLRLLDTTLRQDLQGATARFTPPLNPLNNLGYFEYGENAPADFQMEDGDDYLAFTTRTPEGQVFTGRQWLGGTANQYIQPTTITSNVAEVIYFLRNGNLYRRTFLVVPERAPSMVAGYAFTTNRSYSSYMFGPSLNVSWLGMNDISAHPSLANPLQPQVFIPVPNSLGQLTNREYRAFRPRFVNDFSTASTTANQIADGIPDDNNGDDVPDYYQTLYYDGGSNNGTNPNWHPNGRVVDYQPFPVMSRQSTAATAYDVYAFPFIYPGMYSVPADYNSAKGWIHQLFPNSGAYNHSPLETGDSNLPTANQTWFGFPTWRETMTGYKDASNLGWTDPLLSPGNNSYTQALPLRPLNPTALPGTTDTRLLPPVTQPGTQTTPFGFDGAGSSSFVIPGVPTGAIWEDDLIMTNVRSFDVKAYDPDATLYGFGSGYRDLGYAGLDAGLNETSYSGNSTYFFQPLAEEPKGFGHEGRIPPSLYDFRANPTRKAQFAFDLKVTGTTPTASNYNVGDNSTGVIRLRRVFDTWSTDYTNAPQSDIFLNGVAPAVPIYPSFPAPYPSPLRGIQIQIRVADPRGERVKVLTIRQDFTDKL